MTLKKRVKLAVLAVARSLGLFALARMATRNAIVIVGWHGVSLEDEHIRFTTLFISEDEFRKRLAYLTKQFTIVSLDEAIRQRESGTSGPRRVVLTFDDGFYNFFVKAAPILREYKATATVFLVTQRMVSQQPAHNLLLRDIALSTRLTSVDSTVPGVPGRRRVESVRDQERLAADLTRELEQLPLDDDQRTCFCRNVAQRLGVPIEPKISSRMWHALSPREVGALSNEGFSMQLHTHRHRNVVGFSDTIVDEVVTCRRIVEETTGRSAEHFCYPSGLWDRRAWEPLRACGIRSAVTTRRGPNFAKTPALALRRYLTGEEDTQLEFEFELSGLSWLVHAIFHPTLWNEPSEKRRRYKEDGNLF